MTALAAEKIIDSTSQSTLRVKPQPEASCAFWFSRPWAA